MEDRLSWARALAAVTLALVSSLTLAQTYPVKPIRMLSGFPPGGALDLVARPLAQKLSDNLGQPVVLEHRPGADTIIAMEALAKAPPDGYTIALGINSALTMNPALYSRLPYDPARDFAPVALVVSLPLAFVAHPSLEASSTRDLAAFIKSQPGKLSYGAGNTLSRLGGELFKTMAGGDMVAVMYKGSAPTLQDLLRGEIKLAVEPVATAAPHVKAGKLKFIGVATLERTPIAPDVPTVAESGFPGFEVPAWYALLAPAGTPKPILAQLHQETMKALRQADVMERLAVQGFQITPGTGDEVSAKASAERERWTGVIRQSGIKLD